MMRTRMLAAIAAAVGLAAAGCYQEDSVGPDPIVGTQVLLTDAPFPFDSVESVNIHIVRISASTTSDTSGGQEFVTITSPDKRFNLLDLQQGKTALVGAGDLPAGEYHAVRMVIDTHRSDIRMAGGRLATVDWGSPPASGEIVLNTLVQSPVNVPAEGADIVIDFDVGRSFFHGYGAQEFVFSPVIRAVNRAATGNISGVITGDANGDGTPEPIRNVAITVVPADSTSLALWSVIATGHTDATGAYNIAFLVPGDYKLQIDPLSQVALNDAETAPISVTAGATAQKNITLPVRDLAYIFLEGSFVLDTGGTTVLRARVGDAQGRAIVNPSVTWSSSAPAVASLTANGDQATITALSYGQSTITATSGGRSTSVTLSVVGRPDSSGGNGGVGGAVASVTLNPTSATPTVGDSLGFYANLRDANGQALFNRQVDWQVSDSSVVWIIGRFGSSLILRAAKVGTATVTATSEGKSASATVTVAP